MIRVLQVTDTHLFAKRGVALLGVDTDATFSAVLDAGFDDGPPDVVLLTGDIAQAPDDEVYQRVARELEARHSGPMMWVPGNHDLGEPFSGVRYSHPVVELGAWTILGVDTHVDDQIGGHVEEAELQRLAGAIDAARGEHVLVVGHHHPAPIGTAWLDAQQVDNGDALLEILSARSQVAGYLFGHVHQPFDALVDGVRLLGTPSSCFQFAAGSARFSVEMPSWPGFRWLELADDGRVETEVKRLAWSVDPDLSGVGY